VINKEKIIYEIVYYDKIIKDILTTLGNKIEVGSVEYSWYDIKKKVRIHINKNDYISRVEVKHGR